MPDVRLPAHRSLKPELLERLLAYENVFGPLPGIVDPVRRSTLVDQMVSSLRRTEYIAVLLTRPMSRSRMEPSSGNFDPLKAAIVLARSGKVEEAVWATFVATHFGRHVRDGWKLAANVYGSFGDGPIWTAERYGEAPGDFTDMLEHRRSDLDEGIVSGRFSNHRQYQSRQPAVISRVFRTFHAWQFGEGGLDAKIRTIHREHGQNPTGTFDALYRSMRSVHGFGRLGMFDFLTMIGKLQLAPVVPGSVYLTGATGPLRGARLLCQGDVSARIAAKTVERVVDRLDDHLAVGKQVLEDSLCNWQKSPDRYVYFAG